WVCQAFALYFGHRYRLSNDKMTVFMACYFVWRVP
ncbi:MAG: hypothetical protein ACI9FJ_001522, partial [Alteromonadaceae bacterium]